ncbi:MAG: NigD-like N-terminal domain-containing protein, partial [Duncaniella sp.]|nr:NigD-like N-terminal domain-containing protein [Duncaniella sp.]
MNQFVKKAVRFLPLVALTAMSVSLQSCLDDDNDNSSLYRPTAVVTVCPSEDGTFSMVLNDETSLVATNMTASPFGNKEVRALVNYTEDPSYSGANGVQINW